jgi:hypothetical protein
VPADGAREGREVVESFVENRAEDLPVRLLALVHDDVAEARHVLHPPGQIRVQEPRLFEHREGLLRLLRKAGLLPRDDVHGDREARLAGALQIQDQHVLDVLILQPCRIAVPPAADAAQAAIDDGRLGAHDLVRHRSAP